MTALARPAPVSESESHAPTVRLAVTDGLASARPCLRLTARPTCPSLPGRYRKIRCCGGEPCKHCRTGRRACLYVSVAEWQSFHKGVRVDHPPEGEERSSASASPPSTSNRSNPYSASSVLGKRTRADKASFGQSKKKVPTMKAGRPRAKMAVPATSTPSLRSSISVVEPSSTPSSSSAESSVYSGYYSPAPGIGSYAPSWGLGAEYVSSASSAAPSKESTPEVPNVSFHVPASSIQVGALHQLGTVPPGRASWPAAAYDVRPSATLEYPRPYEHSGPPSPFLSTHPIHQHSYYTAETERPLNVAGWVPPGFEPVPTAFDNQPSTTPPASSTMPASLSQKTGYYLGFSSQDLDRILRSYANLLPPAEQAPAVAARPPPLAVVSRKTSVSYNSAAEADLSALREFELGPSYHAPTFDGSDGPHDVGAGGDNPNVSSRIAGAATQTAAVEDLVVGLGVPALSLPSSPTPAEDWSGYGFYF